MGELKTAATKHLQRSRCNKATAKKPVQQSHCTEAFAIKPLQSDVVFSYLQLFSSRILWKTKQFNFSLVNFSLFLDNKYNEHSFFSICSRNIALGLGEYGPSRIYLIFFILKRKEILLKKSFFFFCFILNKQVLFLFTYITHYYIPHILRNNSSYLKIISSQLLWC